MGRWNEREEKLRTSKEHPRNMLATCLLLWWQWPGASVPLWSGGYCSGGGTSASVCLRAFLRPLPRWYGEGEAWEYSGQEVGSLISDRREGA
jgi:hypothetical protein